MYTYIDSISVSHSHLGTVFSSNICESFLTTAAKRRSWRSSWAWSNGTSVPWRGTVQGIEAEGPGCEKGGSCLDMASQVNRWCLMCLKQLSRCHGLSLGAHRSIKTASKKCIFHVSARCMLFTESNHAHQWLHVYYVYPGTIRLDNNK